MSNKKRPGTVLSIKRAGIANTERGQTGVGAVVWAVPTSVAKQRQRGEKTERSR
jgi:hypothetical protein